MAFGLPWRFKRQRGGGYKVRIPEAERELLAGLPAQVLELLDADDPSTFRLFPPAYTDDPARNDEYQRFMGDDLQARRRKALALLEETAGADRIDEEQANGWLSALNDLRLVLGANLDITDEADAEDVAEDDPRAPGFALYGYLTFLQGELIEALFGSVPEEGTEDVT
jgi:hypothetical protein